jgi:hypothetical protein
MCWLYCKLIEAYEILVLIKFDLLNFVEKKIEK